MTSWYWSDHEQEASARRAMVTGLIKTVTIDPAGPPFPAADLLKALQAAIDAQSKILHRPSGYPVPADCVRAGDATTTGSATPLRLISRGSSASPRRTAGQATPKARVRAVGRVLNHLITPETRRAHRARWFVWAGGEKLPRNSKMRGTWGHDVTCPCGWESRTGGATRAYVEELLRDHRYEAQSAAA